MNSQRGVTLYLALAMLAILLGIAFGVSAIVFGQLRTLRDIGLSTVAFYATDTGIERELLDKNYLSQGSGYTYACFIDLDNANPPIDCSVSNVCPAGLPGPGGRWACAQVTLVQVSAPVKIKSDGYYRGVRRTIEISF